MATSFNEMNNPDNPEFNGYQKISWDWESNSSGAVSSQVDKKYSGMIVKVIIIPDSGDTAPSADYDITITDESGVDVLEGNGANCSATATKYLDQSDGLGCVLYSKLTLTIANAGDANGGTIHLFIA